MGLLFDFAAPAAVALNLPKLVTHAVGNEVLLLLVQVMLILGLSRVMGMLFARMRQPQVVGEMIAGIMLGPSVMGAIPGLRAYQAMLFPQPSASLDLLNVLSQLGVIFFLFLVGLEFEFELVRKRGRSTLVTALSSIAVPFFLGLAVALFLYSRGVFHGAPRLPAALFVGAAMSVTAFPVLARILTERNLQKTKLGAAAIAAAAINDVAAWVILAFVVAIAHGAAGSPQGAQGGGHSSALRTVGLSAVYAAVMFFLVRPFLKRLQAIYDQQGRLSQNVVSVVFLLILASSWSTERIGIHAMFGAFLLGVVMPKGTQFVRHITEKLEDFTVVFLLPIFFAFTGLKTKLGLLNSGELWLYTMLVIAAACVGKFAGATGPARLFGSTWREASAIGVLMNTRGLVELVILTVGLQFGVISEEVFAMMVIMALVTTFMTTPLLHGIYPPRVLEAEATRTRAAVEPAPAKAFTILIPVAAPRSGGPLLALADMISGPDEPNRRVLALHLRRPVDRSEFRTGLREAQQAAGDESLRSLLASAEQRNIPVEAISFVSRDIAADIARTARDRHVDLVLMGFHNPIFGRSMLGGKVHRVLASAPADVGVFVDRGFLGAGRVLVPFLGGRHDRLAMQIAGRFARNASAQVTVLHVTAPKGKALNAKEAVDRVFHDPSQPLPVQLRVVESDDPVGTVIQQSEGFDLVVIGVAEEWGLESHLFGWRPERIAAGCPTSLLVVRQYKESEVSASPPASQAVAAQAV